MAVSLNHRYNKQLLSSPLGVIGGVDSKLSRPQSSFVVLGSLHNQAELDVGVYTATTWGST
jgi:hypothetical protein